MTSLYFESSTQFRDWLEKHHDQQTELVVGFYKVGSGKQAITYSEAVGQALCFGWIDGVGKRVDDERYTIRFTPRRTGSIWSNVNIKRVRELEELGLMHPAGLQAFRNRDEKKSGLYSFENEPASLDEAFEQTFKANREAWQFFGSQAPSYRRTAIFWVMSAKKEETRSKRLDTLINDSANGQRLAWATRYQKRSKS